MIAPPPVQQKSTLTPATAPALVPRLCVHAVEGFGKSTLGALAPDPYILMGRGELGYLTLLSAGLVPAVPAIEIKNWGDLMMLLTQLARDPQGCKTLVFDTIGSFERLCHEHVCAKEFKNDWGERGFIFYQRGYRIAASEWTNMLIALDEIHRHGIAILLLAHSSIVTFKNPLGPDFDRYIPDVHKDTWSPTHRWCDAVLFGNFLTIVDDAHKTQQGKKGTAIGGADRVLYTEHRDVFDAKNRFGMEPELWLDDDRDKMWTTLWNAITRKES